MNNYNLLMVNPNQFLRLWHRYNKIGVPDPTQTAINEMTYPRRLDIDPLARVQLENLVAYWRTHAKPGRSLAAMKSLHYAQQLKNFKPKGAPQ